jgi:predicted nucleic acid-binding protein
MGVILDSCIWIAVERGDLAPADVADITGTEPVYLTPPVLAELEYGVHRAKQPSIRNRRASALARIRGKPCLQIDRDTAILFAQICASLDDHGTPSTFRTHDLWIAALAIQHNMRLLTRNPKDFADIPGLRLAVA